MAGMRYVARGETIIRQTHLDGLERKARAHDVYVAATHKLAEHTAREGIIARTDAWQEGWLDCTRTFAEYILSLTAADMEAYPDGYQG